MNSIAKMTLLGAALTLISGTDYYFIKSNQTTKEKAQAASIKENTRPEYVEFRRQLENTLHDQPKEVDSIASNLSSEFNKKNDETSIRLYHDFQGDKEMIVIAETAYLYGNKYELRKDTLAVNALK